MPKIAGRESTRKTIKLENIEAVTSFVGVWEKYVYKRPCSVEDCGHIISGHLIDGLYETCGDGAGAAIVYDKSEPPGKHSQYAICVCCLGKLDDAWRAMNGDPE